MSNFPQNFDDDTTLPAVNDNLTEVGGDAINALRDAVFNVEQNIGLGAAGTTPSIAARLGLLINPDGTPNASSFTSLGLVTLPITNSQIIDNAGIPESKLHLDYRTQDLFNYIRELSRNVSAATQWISVSGVKLEPHLMGFIYRHDLSQIDVAESPSLFLNNKFRQLRDNTNSYTLINDMNGELLAHQWADGSLFGTIQNVITNDGSVYPSNYAHTASGVFLNTSRFVTVPQTNNDLQQFADYIDGASIFLLGTRIQNLYTSGISRVSRSSSLLIDGYGQAVVPVTAAIAFLNIDGTSSSPNDDIFTGDDIIQFQPTGTALTNNVFTAQFAAVRVGDIVRVNYGTIEVAWVITEKKYIQTSNTFIVRINGKNIAYAPNATARIDRSLLNANKYGVLATSQVPVNGIAGASPSLIIATPRGAQALGIGFNADQFDNAHYLLYLALYPTGNPQDGYNILPPIDVTGNQGSTPGLYTLDSIVNSTNLAFRQPGYNYRFVAFQYQGEFGIMLADSYNNASFSVMSATVVQSGPSAGNYDPVGTGTLFANNVVGIFPNSLGGTFSVTNSTNAVTASVSQTGTIAVGSTIIFNSQPGFTYTIATVAGTAITLTAAYSGTTSLSSTAYLPFNSVALDPLGFGPFNANIASPPYMSSYSSALAAQNPTKMFVPLKRNNYYVNGVELERMDIDVGQALDTFGDGYWTGTITQINASLSTLSVTYRVALNLSASELKIGKTLVVQSLGQGGLINFGRFIISNVQFENCNCTNPSYTDITVYDAVHANGSSPSNATLVVGSQVALYFNSDSVSFNKENASDFVAIAPHPSFKRHFEIYIDDGANTYTHERGRFNISGINPLSIDNGIPLWNDINLALIDLVYISPKLRGYQFGSVNKITLNMLSFNATTGVFSGYLCSWDGTVGDAFNNRGPLTNGKMGEVVRFYDETNIDYIDVIFDLSLSISSFTNKQLDIQLFPTLSLDDEEMLLSTCQVNDNTGVINRIVDRRQFGNTSEKDLSTSALNFISAAPRLLNINGVVRGFDLEATSLSNPNGNQLYMMGGEALVNGNFIQINNETVIIPLVKETYLSTLYNINWILCVNQGGEYQPIPLLDYDPVLATPNSPQRILTLFNVVNSQTYAVDATTFSDLINNRKDLTPLYFIASTVVLPIGATPASISLFLQDVRRFVNDQDSIIPPTLTPGSSQGNFRNFNAALHWLVFNSNYQNTLKVKGNYVVPNDLGLLSTGQNYDIANQGGNSSLTFSSTMSMLNVQFSELTLSFLGSLVAGGVTFVDSPLTVASGLTLTSGVVKFNNRSVSVSGNVTSTAADVSFNNCSAVSVVGNLTTTTNYTTFNSCPSVGIAGSLTANIGTNTFNDCSAVTISGAYTSNAGINNFNNCAVVSVGGAFTANVVSNTFEDCTTVTTGAFTANSHNNTFDNCSTVTINGAFTGNSGSNLFNNCSTVVVSGNFTASTGFTTFNDCSVVNISGTLTAANPTFNFGTITIGGGVSATNPIFQNSTVSISNGFSATNPLFQNCAVTIVGIVNISNAIFTNCTVTITGNATITGSSFNNCTLSISGTSNLSTTIFDNCTNIVLAATTMTNSVITNTTVSFGTSTFNNVKHYGSTVALAGTCTFTNGCSYEQSSVTVGSTLTVSSFTMIGCILQINAVNAFILGSNVKMDTCAFTYSVSPVGTPPYDTSDLVNAGMGMMYATVAASTLNNIIVNKCSFLSTLSDHPPFISIQVTDYHSAITNISITNNQFNSQTASDDVRAVIAFTSTITAPAASSAYPKSPRLVGVTIDHNICNNDQLILISVVRPMGVGILGGPLVAINTSISDNVCGTIGFLTASGDISNTTNNAVINNGIVRDKKDQLVIARNTCKLITNLDHRGAFIPFHAAIDWVQMVTGDFAIINNSANWIGVGNSSYYTGSPPATLPYATCIISHNNLTSANAVFLNTYTDSLNSTLFPPNIGIALYPESANQSSSGAIISNNVLTKKEYFNSNGTGTNYFYGSAIFCYNNAQMTDNYVDSVISDGTVSAPILSLGANITANVVGNTFRRGGLNIGYYVLGPTTSTNGVVSITDNIFDSPTTNSINNSEATVSGIPMNWNCFNNKNQTGYMPIYKKPYLVDSFVAITPYPDSDEFVSYSTGGGLLTGPEYIHLEYDFSFVLLPGTVQTQQGSNIINCNIPISGSPDFSNLLVEFDSNGQFYAIASVTFGGGILSQIVLDVGYSPTPTNPLPPYYIGLSNGSASAKLWSNGSTNPSTQTGLPFANQEVDYSFFMELNNILPTDVQVLNLVIGIGTNITNTLVGGTYVFTIYASNLANFQLTSLPGTMADSYHFSYPATGTISSNTITIGTGAGQTPPANFVNTQFMTIDLTSPSYATYFPYFVTGKNRSIRVNYTISLTTSQGEALMLESPLLVKFRW